MRQQQVEALALVEDSSLQTRIIARAYGAVRAAGSGTWFMIAAPSTSQPIGADVGPGQRRVVEDRANTWPCRVCSASIISSRDVPSVSAAA